MDVAPTIVITANGDDITAVIAERLSELVLSDESGVRSDKLTIKLTNHDPDRPLILPPEGAELTLALGFDGVVEPMGDYVVDDLVVAGPPDVLEIHANAAPQRASTGGRSSLLTQRSRSYPAGTTLAELAAGIASENGIDAAVSSLLEGIPLAHIDQADESDTNLLTRIARQHDAAVKIAGGVLIVVPRGRATGRNGEPLEAVELPRNVSSRYRAKGVKAASREGTTIATWRDLDTGEHGEASAGEGEPVQRLRHVHGTVAEAEAAATADRQRRARSSGKLSLSLPGSRATCRVQAEGRILLPDYPAGVAGDWLAVKVKHTITKSAGYRFAVEGEDYRPIGG